MARPAIFITGAAAGIGRATALLFAARGWFVGLFDVDEAGLAALGAQLPADACISAKLDVTDFTAMQAALERFCAASSGRLDLMFNNAGILIVGPFEDTPAARYHRMVDINLKGVINGCHAALPWLRKTPGARLVNMASASAFFGPADFSVYGASKFAVRGLTEALSVEWSRYDIAVMDVMPLFVNTPMVQQHAGHEPKSLQRMGLNLQADDIAHTVWKAATRPRWTLPVHWLPGLQTKLMYLGIRLMPTFLNRFTVKLLSGY